MEGYLYLANLPASTLKVLKLSLEEKLNVTWTTFVEECENSGDRYLMGFGATVCELFGSPESLMKKGLRREGVCRPHLHHLRRTGLTALRCIALQ